MALQKLISRTQERYVDQRSEERVVGAVERAVLHFRGQEYIVKVVNVSSRGTMVEANINPRIGESVIVQFEHCSRLHAFVRWIRDGQLGLNFGGELQLAS